MENLPLYIPVTFGLTTILTIWLFYRAARRSVSTLVLIIIWLILQSIISLQGFYTVTNALPPRFLLLVMPPLLFIALLFFTKKGRNYIDNLDPALLTLVHIVRIPVEVILFWLYLYKAIPGLMTFEGRNFDILSGLTAPLIFYIGWAQKKMSKKMLLAWNFICLGLLINIVRYAILSAPFPFQQLAFDQPNRAILYFPFVALPGCIVPLVLLSHLADIRYLLKKQNPV